MTNKTKPLNYIITIIKRNIYQPIVNFSNIFVPELTLNKAKQKVTHFPLLDIDLSVQNTISSMIYDKPHSFTFYHSVKLKLCKVILSQNIYKNKAQ